MKILDVSLGSSFIFLWDNREYKIKRSYIRKFETGYSTRFSRDGINNRTEDRTKVNRERSEERAKNRRWTSFPILLQIQNAEAQHAHYRITSREARFVQ